MCVHSLQARMSVLNKNSERGERQDLLIAETAKRMSPDRSATTYPRLLFAPYIALLVY